MTEGQRLPARGLPPRKVLPAAPLLWPPGQQVSAAQAASGRRQMLVAWASTPQQALFALRVPVGAAKAALEPS
jgi:hypothetical protein